MKVIPAVNKQRSRTFAEMGLAGIELGEMRDELDGGVALSDGKHLEPCQERVIRQPGRDSKDVFMHDRV